MAQRKLWGVLPSFLTSPSPFRSLPWRQIIRIVNRINLKEWLGANTGIRAELVHNVRNWAKWFEGMGTQMAGGFIGEGSLHAYIFMRRKDRQCPCWKTH